MALETKVAVREGFLDSFLVASDLIASSHVDFLEAFCVLEHLDVTGDAEASEEVGRFKAGAVPKHCDVTC